MTNVVMECFFKYLKKEEWNRRTFQSVEQLKQSLVTYISDFYNPIRPHSHNHGLFSNQAKSEFFRNFVHFIDYRPYVACGLPGAFPDRPLFDRPGRCALDAHRPFCTLKTRHSGSYEILIAGSRQRL